MDDNTYTLLSVAIAGLVVVLTMFSLKNEVRNMRITLNSIAKHLDVPDILLQKETLDVLTESVQVELKELISKGEKIKAIKRVRVLTGLGLVEAKEYVDRLSMR